MLSTSPTILARIMQGDDCLLVADAEAHAREWFNRARAATARGDSIKASRFLATSRFWRRHASLIRERHGG